MLLSKSQLWLPMIPVITTGIGMLLTLSGFGSQAWVPMLLLVAFTIGILLTLISFPIVIISSQSCSKNQWQKLRLQKMSTTCFIWKYKARVLVQFFMLQLIFLEYIPNINMFFYIPDHWNTFDSKWLW